MIANDGNIMEHAVPFDGSMDLNRDGDEPGEPRASCPGRGAVFPLETLEPSGAARSPMPHGLCIPERVGDNLY